MGLSSEERVWRCCIISNQVYAASMAQCQHKVLVVPYYANGLARCCQKPPIFSHLTYQTKSVLNFFPYSSVFKRISTLVLVICFRFLYNGDYISFHFMPSYIGQLGAFNR